MTTITDALRRTLGDDRLVTDEAALAAHRIDYWILAHLRARENRLNDPPVAVVQPRDTAEVAAAVRVAREHRTPIVPYGGGSGVLGGAMPPAGSLVVDLRRMDRLLDLNETALLARVQAGMLGSDYETAVTARGYTTGHYPQSIALATIGGLVATRSAGQFSTLYGNIEDLCLGLEVVLASGDVIRLDPVPRASTGPSLRELFLGSEGTLGIVTEATLRLHPIAERRRLSSYTFASMDAALDVIRRIVRVGWRPAVVRLYDAPESQGHFGKQWHPAGRCVLVLLSEGPAPLADAEYAACRDLATAAGGEDFGEAPVVHWLEHRNTVPTWDVFLEKEVMVDTIEIAATWDRVGPLYERVVAALQQRPGILSASAHSSHSYKQGTNLYITFVLKPDDFATAERDYLDAWGCVMQTAIDCGGTIAHHHGIGRLRTPWLERELRSAYPVLRAVKRALDPDGLLNPGVLVPTS
jgi:alkyldihydroxyacetonephosphate synthase